MCRCPVQRSTRSSSPPPPPFCLAAAFQHLSPCSSSCSCGDSGLPLSLCLSFLNSNLCLQQSFVVHSCIYFLPSYWTTSTIARWKFSQCSGSEKLQICRCITKYWLSPRVCYWGAWRQEYLFFPIEVISTPSPAVIFSKLLINIRISKVCKSANISLIHFIGMYLKMDNMPSQYYMEERSVQVYRAWLIVLLLAWSRSRWLDAEGEFCYTRGRAQPAPKKAQSISSDNVGEDNSLPPSKLFNLWILVFDQDVAVDISDKKTMVPTSRWFALSQVAASIRPWHRRMPGHWQRPCCRHRCRRFPFHNGMNNWSFLRCSICATTVPNARDYVSKRQVIDIGIGRSPGINNINFNTENIDRSIAISLHQSWQHSKFNWQIWDEAFGDSIGGLEGGPTTSNCFFAQFPLNRIVVEYRGVLFK